MSFCIWTDVRIFAEDKSQTFEHDFGPDSQPYFKRLKAVMQKIFSSVDVKYLV